MSDEELKKAMEFVLSNQAQFYADLQQIQETNKEIQKQQKETDRLVRETSQQFQEFQKDAEQRFGVLERATVTMLDSTVENAKNIAQLTEDVKELREAQKATDGRLNAVIFMAEKYFSGENGKKKK